MIAPRRIQRQRTRGWRMPEGSVYVGRPSRWGNPYRVGDTLLTVGPRTLQRMPGGADAADVVWAYEEALTRDILNEVWRDDVPRELRGRHLVCWCPLDRPCHADVLLRFANGPSRFQPMSADDVARVLGGYAFGYASEDQLQSGIASALTAEGLSPEREVRFGERDRVDVLVDGVAIEVKLAGTADQLLRQLRRYSVWPEVRELLVVTTLSRHRVMPPEINGRPCRVLHIGGVR